MGEVPSEGYEVFEDMNNLRYSKVVFGPDSVTVYTEYKKPVVGQRERFISVEFFRPDENNFFIKVILRRRDVDGELRTLIDRTYQVPVSLYYGLKFMIDDYKKLMRENVMYVGALGATLDWFVAFIHYYAPKIFQS